MKEMTLEDIHSVQLDLLKRIDEYCTKNNLRYSLGGGTLLGAVRHHGFIPWDDDVDIMLPRPDYEILRDNICDHYNDLGIFGDSDTHPQYTYFKLFSKKTLLVEGDDEYGVFIDVFPIDGFPNQSREVYKFLFKSYMLSHLLEYKDSSNIRIKVLKPMSFFLPSFEKTRDRIKKLYMSYDFDKSKLATVMMGSYGIAEIMRTIVYNSYCRLEFEGIMLSCIRHFDLYLTQHYGDYMQLPPIEDRVSAHSFIAYWK